MNTLSQFKTGLVSLILIVIIGTVGYFVLEDNFSLMDSFYMTIITISTTGFKEINTLDAAGRMLTIVLIIFGVSSIAYTGGKAAQLLIEAHIFRRRRMNHKVESMKNHYIVCGFGRMGKQICDKLKENNQTFVVVEKDEDSIDLLIEKNFLFINGDATNDEILIKAGIKNAKGFMTVIRSDAENVFATLSARELNPEIFIVTRSVEEGSESKLRKAGANKVIKPYELAGSRMVQLLLRPSVTDFIDGVARNRDVEIALEEIVLNEKSKLIGLTLANSPIRRDLNIIIVAIGRESGKFLYNPRSDTKFNIGDKLIAIGDSPALSELTKLCVG